MLIFTKHARSLLSPLLCLATDGALFSADITPEEVAKYVGEKMLPHATTHAIKLVLVQVNPVDDHLWTDR